jgi:AbrB family looped-hinge helix DNA binding protein
LLYFLTHGTIFSEILNIPDQQSEVYDKMAVELLRIRSNFQITLPPAVRRAVQAKVGDTLLAEVTQDGSIVLKPVAIIDKSQEYFWTRRWQAGESEAEEDIRTGRIREYGSMRQLASDLASEAGIDPKELEDQDRPQ